MERLNGKGIKGYWIGEGFICKDCVDSREAEILGKGNIIIESEMDEGADYICGRCGRRI